MTDITKLRIYIEILIEREKQEKIWGIQNYENHKWLTILTEGFGEVAKAILEDADLEIQEKLIHVITVGVAWLECIERTTE